MKNMDNLDKETLELRNRIAALEEENFSLKSVIKDLPGSIYWKDLNGVYLGRNAYALEKLQSINLESKDATVDSAIGKTDYDYFIKKIADKYREHDLQVINSGKELAKEEETILPNGKTIVQLSVKRPLYDKNGKIIGIIGNTVDLTAQKEIENLRKKKELSEKTAIFMQKVAGCVAHELRTPLASICLQVDLLFLDPRKEAVEVRMRNIKHLIHSASHIISMVLVRLKNLAKNEINREISHLTFSRCSIGKNISEALDEYPFYGEQKKLITWCNGNDFEYVGDDILTKHVLYNLIKNSLAAIKLKGSKDSGEITIKLSENGKYNTLIFRDTASGIAPEILEKLFGDYQSYDPTNQGTGLGLAFCKMVMKNYGGDIVCTSVLNKSTEFVLSFPKFYKQP